jgi:hypothetical protein
MNVRFLASLAGIVVFSGTAMAGPFGVTMGKPVAIYAGRPSTVKGVYKVTAPQPYSEFESYSVVATASSGVCKIWGIGRDHSNDRYGTDVRSAYDRLKSILDSKYGKSEEFSYLKSGALWKDSNEWVMSIRQKERTVITFWSVKDGPPLPDGLVSISLEIKATSSDTAYIDLTYEFENFKSCKTTLSAQDADGL